jgi:hypothetical protein
VDAKTEKKLLATLNEYLQIRQQLSSPIVFFLFSALIKSSCWKMGHCRRRHHQSLLAQNGYYAGYMPVSRSRK